MNRIILFLVVLTAICFTCEATVLLPPITKEKAIEQADLFAQVKVTGIAPLNDNGSTQKWASIISVEVLTKGVSAKTQATVLWNQALANATLTKKTPPLIGHTYTAYLRKGNARSDYEPVHPDWAFVDPMPDINESESAYVEHVVQDGDTLYGLALRYYGKGQRWRVLRVANFTKDAEGEVYPLRPGMRIYVPTFPMKRQETKQDTQPTNAQYSSLAADPAADAAKHFARSQNHDQFVLGKSEAELKKMFGRVDPVEGSFSLLVSKNLHPYRPPDTHRLLRLGDTYIVFELKDDKVIKVHRVSG
jgi:hypothetical protein